MTSTVKTEVPDVLPRGPHNLPAEVVQASQRERLLQAMLECVAERGYEATTVPQVVAKARVGRQAFYALFSDKTDCFLALCDRLADRLLTELTTTGERDWVGVVRAGTQRYLRWWQDDPAMARAYLVELPAAGSRAAAFRAELNARFTAMHDQLTAWARRQQPELPPVPATTTRLVAAAIEDLIAQEVRAGRVSQLSTLEDELVHFQVKLFGDEATARRAVPNVP